MRPFLARKIAEIRATADYVGPNTAEREKAQSLLREWADSLEAEAIGAERKRWPIQCHEPGQACERNP